MAYRSYFRWGDPQDIEYEPTPGNKYWVVLRTTGAEVAFQALLTTSIKRDHHPAEQDQTPSYQFDNGVVLHGEDIRFYKKMPSKPMKGLWLGKIFRHIEGGNYELSSKVMESEHQMVFPTLEDLKAFLESIDIDTKSITNEPFVGSIDCELYI